MTRTLGMPKAVARLRFILALACAITGPALAEPVVLKAPLPTVYKQECASCHQAYPPGLLSQQAWTRQLASLDKHFGVDASLDAAAVAEISAWLLPQAAAGKYAQPSPHDRITTSAWFVREHREIGPVDGPKASAVWRHPLIRQASNCLACHPGAEQQDFREERLRVPMAVRAALKDR